MTTEHRGLLDRLAGLVRWVRPDRVGQMARKVRRARKAHGARPVRRDQQGRPVQPVAWAPQVRQELLAQLDRPEPQARKVRRAIRDLRVTPGLLGPPEAPDPKAPKATPETPAQPDRPEA